MIELAVTHWRPGSAPMRFLVVVVVSNVGGTDHLIFKFNVDLVRPELWNLNVGT